MRRWRTASPSDKLSSLTLSVTHLFNSLRWRPHVADPALDCAAGQQAISRGRTTLPATKKPVKAAPQGAAGAPAKPEKPKETTPGIYRLHRRRPGDRPVHHHLHSAGFQHSLQFDGEHAADRRPRLRGPHSAGAGHQVDRQADALPRTRSTATSSSSSLPPQPGLYVVKRVIGLPGDRIHLQDGVVYRNGEKLNEPYVIRCDENQQRAHVHVLRRLSRQLSQRSGEPERLRSDAGMAADFAFLACEEWRSGGAARQHLRHGRQPRCQPRQPLLGLRAARKRHWHGPCSSTGRS